MARSEADSIRLLSGVGETIQSSLDHLGIRTIGDLLRWYPREYIDGSQVHTIAGLPRNQRVAIRVTILHCKVRPSKTRGLRITEALAQDETGQITLRWFNQPYLTQKLEPGTEWIMIGVAAVFGKELVMTTPLIESEARILSVYGQTKGVSSKMLRGFVGEALKTAEIKEDLPVDILESEGLPTRKATLTLIHQPQEQADVQIARRHIAFAEVFWFFARLRLASQVEKKEPGQMIGYDVSFLQELVSSLPFELTAGQKKAVWECVQDMASGKLMTRLVNGDVGSGKTLVAGLVSAVVAKAGFQSVLLVPTEILAKQHQQSLERLLAPANLKVVLWTAAQKDEVGEADIIVGTHAVLQETFMLERLALVVIDEQHRFGVRQRQTLRKSATIPHVLSMTATPIPRTLALALYSDLAVSLLPDKPKNRLPTATYIVRHNKHRQEMHLTILRELQAGHQAFVICPLIDEKKKIDAEGEEEIRILTPDELEGQEKKTVLAEAERLRREHPEYGTVEAIHGKMKAAQKREIMDRMARGEINVLVATSVIEVGVDVPNATVMVIEGAERFGLAQLHQFRGRVGRGTAQSYCFLCPELHSETIVRRLQVLADHDSGFAVAEQDLAIRGPGELGGYAQSGLPDFQMASLTDVPFLQHVKEMVERYMNEHADFADQYADFLYPSSSAGLE